MGENEDSRGGTHDQGGGEEEARTGDVSKKFGGCIGQGRKRRAAGKNRTDPVKGLASLGWRKVDHKKKKKRKDKMAESANTRWVGERGARSTHFLCNVLGGRAPYRVGQRRMACHRAGWQGLQKGHCLLQWE